MSSGSSIVTRLRFARPPDAVHGCLQARRRTLEILNRAAFVRRGSVAAKGGVLDCGDRVRQIVQKSDGLALRQPRAAGHDGRRQQVGHDNGRGARQAPAHEDVNERLQRVGEQHTDQNGRRERRALPQDEHRAGHEHHHRGQTAETHRCECRCAIGAVGRRVHRQPNASITMPGLCEPVQICNEDCAVLAVFGRFSPAFLMHRSPAS